MKKRNKWGHKTNLKKTQTQQIIFKLRQIMSCAYGIPIEYITSQKTSPYLKIRLMELNKTFLDGCDEMTSHLPRKKKKELRKTCEGFRRIK